MRALVLTAAVAALALGAAPSPGQVKVEGETRVVVTKVPFTLTCVNEHATLFQWDLPPGWRGKRKGRKITVTQAPDGVGEVTVTATRIIVNKDYSTQAVEDDHSLVVEVRTGAAPPAPKPPAPPGPNPGPNPAPGPDSGFVASVRAAYAQETVSGKEGYVKSLAQVYAACADELDGERGDRFKTWGVIPGLMEAVARAAGVLDKLRRVDAVVVRRLSSRLGADPAAQPNRVLTIEDRAKIASEFRTVSLAITEALK